MREIKISEGKTIEVKALTRGQVKKLREKGFNPISLTKEQAEDAMDETFTMALDADTITALDDEPYPVSLAVWRAILAETYGAPAEEKNS